LFRVKEAGWYAFNDDHIPVLGPFKSDEECSRDAFLIASRPLMHVRRLVDFPYVLVRLRCDACKRGGSYRLARLAVKYGAEILLDDLIVGYRLTVRGGMIRVGRVAHVSRICRRDGHRTCQRR
jgi:hypothetical protein